MTLTRIKLERFTAFEDLDVALSPGVNIFIGANGTGKTHLLKVAYAACDITRTRTPFTGKLINVFRPYQDRLGRLVQRTGKSTTATVSVQRDALKLVSESTNHAKDPSDATVKGRDKWLDAPVESAYIPVKEMLANAPGFRSLYSSRLVHFEEVYADIVDRAFLPILKGPHDPPRKKLLAIIQNVIDGKVMTREETFFLRNKHGELEFTLLAEGMRKLALLWLLIQNGTLLNGAVLLWDEPESNLNPKVVGSLVEILLELQRLGVQIMLATHDYVVLKEFDLRLASGDRVRYHALFRDADGRVRHHAADTLATLEPNTILDSFTNLYDREVQRSLGD
jgi:ABC-type ATPase involved in cell division